MNQTHIKRIKSLLYLLPFILIACHDDDNECIDPTPNEEVRITNVSDTILVNTKDIDVGHGNDIIFSKTSTIITPTGKDKEVTLDCYGMAAAVVKDGELDTTQNVTNVTLINKGTITIHTKDIVEKYKSQIRTTEDQTPKYYYLRFIGMYAGKNCKVINDGVINVYFDHDPSTKFTVYSIAMTADNGSTIQNNGEIHFYGNGSVRTRIRGFATMSDDVTALNNGTMTAQVDIAEDSRFITTGGTRCSVINDGIMQMRLPGKITCMTRYGDTNLINNNLIDITSIDYPTGYTSVVVNEDKFVCAMFEPISMSRITMPPMLNRGTINISLEGTADSDPYRQGYGIMCDFLNKADWLESNLINDGEINVSQSGPVHFNVAEAGFIGRATTKGSVCNVKLIRWKTKLRDFAQTHDLFLAKGAKMDYTGGQLILAKGDNYVSGTAYSVAPEALIYNAGSGTFRYEYSGYDNLTIKTNEKDYSLLLDNVNKTASLTSNK